MTTRIRSAIHKVRRERRQRVKLHGQKQNNIFSHRCFWRPLFAEFSVFVPLLLRLCEVENHEKFSQSWFHFVSHCQRLWSCWNCHSCDNFPTKYIYNNRHSERALTVMSWKWGWGRIISSRLCERHAEETRDAGLGRGSEDWARRRCSSLWPIRVAPCGK